MTDNRQPGCGEATSGEFQGKAGVTYIGRWLLRRSLVSQFAIVGGVVSLVACLFVGSIVTSLIERAVMRHFGATTALYVDSIISPLLPDMRTTTALSSGVERALDETLSYGALGERLAAMRLWKPDGTVLYANDAELVGAKFPITKNMAEAFSGNMVVKFDRFDILDENTTVPEGPLLEVYNPILQPWSGEVVAVMEFYEYADEFRETLLSARLRSWAAVAAVILVFFLSLAAVVRRGSRTIDAQAAELNQKVDTLTTLLQQNRLLHERVQTATRRTTEANETYLRRIGADLHDGPAQFIALASLRLDSKVVTGGRTPRADREREMASIRASLEEALAEIRSICNGLVLPDIENSSLCDLAEMAVLAHERRTGTTVVRELTCDGIQVGISQRICVYRFVQEGLTNAYRHANARGQSVRLRTVAGRIEANVEDAGSGFDPARVPGGRIGLAGLRDRVESLGGRFELATSSDGTKLSMTLSVGEGTDI